MTLQGVSVGVAVVGEDRHIGGGVFVDRDIVVDRDRRVVDLCDSHRDGGVRVPPWPSSIV